LLQYHRLVTTIYIYTILDTIEPYQIIIIASALGFSAFCSGIEAAFLSADRLDIELTRNPKSLVGKLLQTFANKPTQLITTMLLGSTVSLVVYSAYMAEVFNKLIDVYLPFLADHYALSLFIQTVVSTGIVLVIAELIPKSIFLLRPSKLLGVFALPVALIYYLLWPLVMLTTLITRFFMKYVLRSEYQEREPVFGLTDLQYFIQSRLNALEKVPVETSARIVSNLIEFKKTKVRDCMVPRAELTAINKEEGIPGLRKVVAHSEHSKILVYQGDIDHIIGYCHAKELFKNPSSIDQIITPLMVVSETSLAIEVMLQLLKARKSLVLVVDEFGGVAGIVSLEDLIEEIVGDIQDEHDTLELMERKTGPNTYLLSARHEIEYLNEKYGWQIPIGDYDTIGGFIISVTERIPELNEQVEIPPFVFTIKSLAKTHINTVQVEVKKAGSERD
jgi:putative hemolysin